MPIVKLEETQTDTILDIFGRYLDIKGNAFSEIDTKLLLTRTEYKMLVDFYLKYKGYKTKMDFTLES